ncbi:hypothetical protein ASF40_05890 [Microbacterium sp. Leaf288]|uniref:hypothetical protein n=1 Tax=Microbacterium sp. Leaf288 TaxID=1736323 RepID=UPI0006F23F33|nr:hypothetical protein [Microbacterium sp. Leaf288]KQP71316.1 hypothetical protein ASF40_05890 [Microbacterium sp. Leaf288]
MTTADGSLGSPYRAIRAVRAREDGPWPGTLVRTAAGDACVLVDADVLGPHWRGWDAAPGGHVLAPDDIVRRVDGHDALLPVCSERLEDFVRRRSARMPLSLGEAVTLGVSVLRGCTEVASTPDAEGEWWLDDAGRPVLATDASARRVFEASAAVLEQVSVDPSAQRTWQTALRAVTAERISVHELEAAEEALFALAEAEPLSTVSLSPRSASDGVARAHAETRRAADVPHDPAPRSMWQTLVAGVDDELSDTLSRATTAVWRRLRRTGDAPRAGTRRAPWLVGGAVAVAVLAGGALWPTASGVATDARPGASPTATPGSAPDVPADADPSATPGSDSPPGAPADLALVTGELLDARIACAGDASCLSTVTVDGAPLPGGAIGRRAAERTVTLLDDFGDIAVLRVDANDGSAPSQMVVILRRDENWLLRDVSDVAQQP